MGMGMGRNRGVAVLGEWVTRVTRNKRLEGFEAFVQRRA